MSSHRIFSGVSLVVAGLGVLAGVSSVGCGGGGVSAGSFVSKASLGRALFNEPNLSDPGGVSCALCHSPNLAFTDGAKDSPTSEGVLGRFGKRNTPTISYMAFSPKFGFDTSANDYIGGQFWDGHALDLTDQVHFPMLTTFEMNNTSKDAIVARLQTSAYATSMKNIYGPNVFASVDAAFNALADAIATYETSPEFSPFTSKYDAYLKGSVKLAADEANGLALFNGKANCAGCHPSTASNGHPPLFTDFSYDNIGLPKNYASKFLTMSASINPDGVGFIDQGLFLSTARPQDKGRFKVPTLRNVAITGPYFHNGWAADLTTAVQFYNKRDSGAFGPSEIPGTINHTELGNLGLNDREVADIVAFLKTLTDGYTGG